MTSQVLFNPLTYIDRLTHGGFTPEQARASAEALESRLHRKRRYKNRRSRTQTRR